MADTLSEAQTWYREALDASRDQREQVEEDLAFSDPSDPQQWDSEEKAARESDPGGARPCLVMDQIGQYTANVAGQVEQRPPAMHALPVGSGADRKVAEQLDGLFRHIEHASRAQQHYARALTSAARAGIGYLIVRPEYTDRALNYQEPRISSEGDPLRVLFDPWSVELDGSDATRGQLLTPLSHAEFERQFGAKADKVSFGDETGTKSEDERESIMVVEEWRVETQSKNIIVFEDSEGGEASLPEDEFHEAMQRGERLQYVRNYTDKYRCVKWVRMSGAEILTKEREYPASGIGIVPVYGYVGWSGGRMRYCGLARRAREPQRAYNYHASEIRAIQATAPKAPWVAADAAVRGFETLWDRASVDSRAFLPYNHVDESGNPIPPPQRPQLSVNLQNHMQGLLQAREDIQAALGMYAANIGKQSNATSGVAYDAQKQQGEASTAHFPSHLQASLGQVGKLCMEMIPRLIDGRRQVRILGIDMTPGTVTIDPGQSEPMAETEQGVSINPNVGKYDVRCVVGAAYSTQRQESREELREMMRSNPEMTPAIAPLWAQTLDVPYADKLTQVLTAVAPDPVKAILQPDKQESTATLKAENEQLKQALQEATQLAHEAQKEADEASAKLQQREAEGDAKEDEVAIKAYDALTKRLQVMGATITPEAVQQLTQQTVMAMLAQPQPTEQGADEMPEMAAEMAPMDGMPMDEQQPLQPEQIPPEMQEPPMPQEPAGPAPEIQELMQGQEHLAQLMEALIRIVQSPRERIPVRGKDGSIERVIDQLMQQQEQR